MDTVDLAYIATHGTTGVWDPGWGRYSSAIYYGVGGSSHDDAFRVPSEVYRAWGDWDAEWVAIDSCLVLNANDMGYWSTAMNGLHLILGFDTIMAEDVAACALRAIDLPQRAVIEELLVRPRAS